MGTAVNASRLNPSCWLVAEIVGLAGSGKTTLIRALSERDRSIKIAPEIQVRQRQHLPTFARFLPRLLPVLFQPALKDRRPTWEEVKSLVYLEGWAQFIQQTRGREKVVLLDQGPVFRLATLHEFGPDLLRSPRMQSWWTRMYRQWAGTLDLIVWLDASEAVLAERIQTRAKRHVAKGKSEAEVLIYLARYRSAFEHVLGQLVQAQAIAGLQFDTSQTPVDAIADDVLAAFGILQNGNEARESSYAGIYTH